MPSLEFILHNSQPRGGDMEHSVAIQTCKKLTSILLFLSTCCALLSLPSHATPEAAAVPQGLIQSSIKQQVLASIPPGAAENAAAFITSPAGKYTAYLLRSQTAAMSGGYGNDFCYIQIQDASSGASVWESECEPVSSSNACSVVFDDTGLEVLDGSNSVWDVSSTGNNNYPATLEMADEGDMRIADKDGGLVWRASDYPRVNQGCGLPGSPGPALESPPSSGPIGGDGTPLFGQQPSQSTPQLGAGGNGQMQQQQPVGSEQGQQAPVQTPPQMTGGSDGQQQPPPPPVGADQGQQAPVQTPPQIIDGGNGQQQQQQQQQQPVGAYQGQQAPVQAPPLMTDGGNGPQQHQPTPFGHEPDQQQFLHPPVQAPTQLPGGASGRQQQQTFQSSNGVNQATGGHGAQPLMDNNRYDSGCSRNGGLVGIGLTVVVLIASPWLLV